MMEGMKGLFYMSYDYYEWENLICISQDEEKLNQRAALDDPKLQVVFSGEESSKLAERERPHYLIKDIETI